MTLIRPQPSAQGAHLTMINTTISPDKTASALRSIAMIVARTAEADNPDFIIATFEALAETGEIVPRTNIWPLAKPLLDREGDLVAAGKVWADAVWADPVMLPITQHDKDEIVSTLKGL